MKWIWYIAQSSFIGWLMYAYWSSDPMMPAGKLSAMLIIAICLCAFLTACITQSWDWAVRKLRALRQHGDTRRDGLGLPATRRSAGERAEHAKRIRVRE